MEEAGIYTGKWDFVTFFVVPTPENQSGGHISKFRFLP